MKRVLVACGNGVATSTVIRSKIEDYLKDHGTPATITQCKVTEVHDKGNDYDLVVTSGKFKDDTVSTPHIMAINLLTGIGEDDTLQQIYDALQD